MHGNYIKIRGKIKRGYKDFSCEPIFENAPGVFRVTLPNRNEQPEEEGGRKSASKAESVENEKNLIMDFVSDNGSITRKQAEELIDAGTTKAFRMLRELCESGKLKAAGKGKDHACYILNGKGFRGGQGKGT